MGKHRQYLLYLFRHKWYVAKECIKSGLLWRGIIHDWHKFLPKEYFPYANHFCGPLASRYDNGKGHFKPASTGDEAFDLAWLQHQKMADHHWQYWTTPTEKGEVKAFRMDQEALLEMLCDWYGASMTQGHGGWKGVAGWYQENKDKMTLHSETRRTIETLLEILAKESK